MSAASKSEPKSLSFADIDVELIDIDKIEPKTSKILGSDGKPKYKYYHIKLKYGTKKYGMLEWNLPPELYSSGVKVSEENNSGRERHTVTALHNLESEAGDEHRAHIAFLDRLYQRVMLLCARGLKMISERTDELHAGLRAKINPKKHFDPEKLIDDEMVKQFWFHIAKDGVLIDNAENMPAFRMKVKTPEDFEKEEHRGLATKYFLPKAAGEATAKEISVHEMVANPHTGNYKARIPYIYVGYQDKLDVTPQIYASRCFNTKPAERRSTDEIDQEEAGQYTMESDEVANYQELFAKRHESNQKKSTGESDPSSALAGVQYEGGV